MVTRQAFTRLTIVATALALVVVMLGAYVRLSDAGLGCPDWPGCYGRLIAPDASEAAAVATRFSRPLEVGKAWKEMAHRYLAGGLGLLTLLLALLAWRLRSWPGQPYRIAWITLALVVFQALLGMWTVTFLLKPLVVVLHLLGGFSILALLWWQVLRNGQLWTHASDSFRVAALRRFRPWAVIAMLILTVQVFLGGWTSSNYAALSCPDVPQCHGAWWPPMNLQEGFVLWRGKGPNYEGGVLPGEARVAIHIVHRVGAALTFLYIGGFALWLMLAGRLVAPAFTVLGLLVAQLSLGLANVVLGLPLAVAVLHNGVAALLLLSLVLVMHKLWPAKTPLTAG